jgi:stage II sporulation protein AA (anti-sigma F factor antagonist)
MTQFSIEKKLLRNGIALLALKGDLDAHTSSTLDDAITDLIKNSTVKIIIDLHGVAYMSSQGIGVLISALSQTHEHDGELVLMRPGEMVKEVLEMLEVSQMFPIVDSQEAALKKF